MIRRFRSRTRELRIRPTGAVVSPLGARPRSLVTRPCSAAEQDHGTRRALAHRWPILVFALLVLAAPCLAQATATTAPADVAATSSWKRVWEHWYILDIAGATAGWMRTSTDFDGERYRTETEQHLKISRGSIEMKVLMTSEFIETEAGVPVTLHFVQDMAMQSIDTRWVFEEDHVRSIAKQGGRAIERELPLPEETWLTPMAAHRYWTARREAGAEDIEYRMIVGEAGLQPVSTRHVLEGEGEYEFDGRALPITIWNTTTSMMPGMAATEKYSSDGLLVSVEAKTGIGSMVTRLATRQEAMAAGAAPPPELMVNTFVPVEPPIERARDTVTATFRVRVREGEMPTLPTAGAQRYEPDPGDERRGRLRVNIGDNVPAPRAEIDDPEYLAPSATVDASDKMILALAKKACRGASEDRHARAEAMRAFVNRHISAKALDTAFATASETARMRRGDCSEHGVLLCAMLRADGIPARVATGLVYADSFAGEQDIFGWHMWTQALIDGHWVDYDATLDRRYDAAHVLTGTSSLGHGSMGHEMSSMMLLLGNLEVEVAEVDHGPVP